ncbi:hypothetical protein IU479_30730 [Nocardia abscessus]|uniref:hypothetical protein n=1 Tax=Nocardia TaxID=1817 RepID=UPI0018936764|nr:MULTISPECIES: hypothetical protein [Nocardia]MBF6222473.1 hypothetical protein [Nocardia abscessus]
MAKDILVSQEYGWTARSGLFEWAVEVLHGLITDQETKVGLETVLDENLGVVDLDALPDEGRREILHVLRDEFVSAVNARFPNDPRTRGHLKVLTLMAKDTPD